MKTLKAKILFLFLCLTNLAFAGESLIPLLKNARLPSDDLVLNDQRLSSKEAMDLKNIDLSNLNPIENEIYDGENNLVDDSSQVAISNADSALFQGALLSNSGLLRFNAISDVDGSLITIHLDKTLHSMLLRKNLLRRLGYKIPAMKYLKTIKINFNSEAEKKEFITRTIPENTLGASERWVVNSEATSVTLQDVVVTVPNEADFYNVAMGIPTNTINSRTIRALVNAYNLVDLNESVNQFSWSTGKIDNKAILLSHFTNNEFNSSIDDVIWMQRKINQLSREDIINIVALSSFPSGISEVLVEKIISRRNVLNQLLNISINKTEVNNKLTIDPMIKNGKVVTQTFPGYASRFSYGDAETPFDQMRYYLYSKLQSNVIDNGINYLNTNLKAFDISTKRAEYFNKQFQNGLQHFVETGELLPIKVGTWTSPMASMRLILSRDIVLGNYLGTDNMVQLADTFGAGLDLGVMLGVEGLPYGAAGAVTASVSLVRTFSHLKPVKSLKNSLKEPYRNLFVPLLKKSLKEDFFTLSELKDFQTTPADHGEERAKKIQEVLKELDKNLDVGESLIMTDRFMPTTSVDVNYNQGILGAGIGISGSVAIIKRIHFYKKAPQVLQVFDDLGHSRLLDLSFHVNAAGVPVLKLSQTYDKGNYKIKSYMVNLSSDLEANPNLFANALGVYEVLKSKNFELIAKNSKPVTVNANFFDKTTGLSFLLWKLKKIKGQTFYDVEAKDGINGKYFSYQKDFMTGANVEAMAKQLANYYLAESLDPNVAITVEGNANPGETYYGKSHTETYRFEAAVDSNSKLEKKFLSLSDVRAGWTMNEKTLTKFVENINKKFNMNLFNKELIDFKKLKLYRIGYHLNLYEAGIAKLSSLSVKDILGIENRYKQEAGCSDDNQNKNTVMCGDLSQLKAKVQKCSEGKLMETDRAICHTELFERLYSDLKFDDFKKLIGENNFYLYGSVDGFRQKSEVLNDTLYSNSYGKIGSPYWNGPFEVVGNLIGISSGEFAGGWLR